MTGPEHYEEAQRLLAIPESTPMMLAAAQVHATLALAAATAHPMVKEYLTGESMQVTWGAAREWAQTVIDLGAGNGQPGETAVRRRRQREASR